MKIHSWPTPPIHSHKNPPAIPEHIRMFGLEYKCVNGNPMLNIDSAPLNRQAIRKSINQSFGHFIKLIQKFDPVHLNIINEIHTQLNETFNKAVEFEAQAVIAETKAENIQNKMILYESIKRVIKR